MPLTMLPVGKEAIVQAYRVEEKTRKFFESLGIIAGANISVISEMQGNLIVNVKGSRIAISKGIAQKLMVQ